MNEVSTIDELLSSDNPTGRSFPEDFGKENGNYYCLCHSCLLMFCGHKRRMLCKACSEFSNEP